MSTDKVEDSMLYEEDCDVSHACSPEQYRPMKRITTMSYFLPTPTPTPTAAKGSVLSKNRSSRVLTSAENLKRLEEKEREKERKAQEKEERAWKRGSKKQVHHDLSTRPVPKLGISEPFSQSEHEKFSHRYENGFDIATDPRYTVWLNAFHPPGDKNSTSCGNL